MLKMKKINVSMPRKTCVTVILVSGNIDFQGIYDLFLQNKFLINYTR